MDPAIAPTAWCAIADPVPNAIPCAIVDPIPDSIPPDFCGTAGGAAGVVRAGCLVEVDAGRDAGLDPNMPEEEEREEEEREDPPRRERYGQKKRRVC